MQVVLQLPGLKGSQGGAWPSLQGATSQVHVPMACKQPNRCRCLVLLLLPPRSCRLVKQSLLLSAAAAAGGAARRHD